LPFAFESTPGLAGEVNQLLSKREKQTRVSEIGELSLTSAISGGADHLLYLIGWMTAGPPNLSAETLAGAGLWAFFRYGWAFEDHPRHVAVRPAAVAIRGRNRAVFSEATGIGASARLLTKGVFPEGPVLVADLDDSFDLLSTAGLIRRPPGAAKRPDYLMATHDSSGRWQLAVLECKGTVNGRRKAISQLATGATQAVSLTSPLPMRCFATASALNLDEEVREIVTLGVEASERGGTRSGEGLEDLPEGLIDAALIRAMRILGRFEEALALTGLEQMDLRDRLAVEFGDGSEIGQMRFRAGTRQMVGRQVILNSPSASGVAEIGFDLELLRAMLAPADRPFLVSDQLAGLQKAARVSPDFPDEPAILFRDGVALRWEQTRAI
jgi:hypothetical protein